MRTYLRVVAKTCNFRTINLDEEGEGLDAFHPTYDLLAFLQVVEGEQLRGISGQIARSKRHFNLFIGGVNTGWKSILILRYSTKRHTQESFPRPIDWQ